MILNHSTNPCVEADHSTRALEINEVTKIYGRHAVVDKVSFVVERGEIFGIIQRHQTVHIPASRLFRGSESCGLSPEQDLERPPTPGPWAVGAPPWAKESPR